ncbi:hypothetical protein D3C80_1813030 [compost metagenome]
MHCICQYTIMVHAATRIKNRANACFNVDIDHSSSEYYRANPDRRKAAYLCARVNQGHHWSVGN